MATDCCEANQSLNIVMPMAEAIITSVVLSLIILFTLFGNILVITSVFTSRPLHVPRNYLIVSLAIADLIIAIVVMPFSVPYDILHKWPLGGGLCKMWLTVSIICFTASSLNLCAMALESAIANCTRRRNANRVMIMIIGVWILSCLMSLIELLDSSNAIGYEGCYMTYWVIGTLEGTIVISSLGSFYIPLFVMTVVYVVTRRLGEQKGTEMTIVKSEATNRHQAEEGFADDELPGAEDMPKGNVKEAEEGEAKFPMIDVSTTEKPSDSNSVGTKLDSDQLPADVTKRSTEFIEDKRMMRTLGVMIAVFVVCKLPFFIVYVTLPFCECCCVSDKFYNFFTWLSYTNSALNPVVYAIFDPDFRRPFKKLLHMKP